MLASVVVAGRGINWNSIIVLTMTLRMSNKTRLSFFNSFPYRVILYIRMCVGLGHVGGWSVVKSGFQISSFSRNNQVFHCQEVLFTNNGRDC